MPRKTGLTTRRFTRCAICTRQSASSTDDLSSCEIQYQACAAYVRSMRELEWFLIAERFDDDGYSGSTLDRPALTRLRELVARRDVEAVVIYRMDRLARSLINSASLLEELRSHGVRLVIVTAPELGDAAGDNLMLNILASFAEFEREMIASRIAESRTRLKARGQRIAGAVPFGYTTDVRTKQLVPLQEEEAIVKWMFSQAAAGQVPADIAEQANEKGSKTKVGSGSVSN
jgi:site-specific DNA recombinase